jgi:hypothetical protein
MKMLIDRLRPFVENKKLKGKRAIIVEPSAEGPKACDPMLQMFRIMFDYVGIQFLGHVFVKAYEKGDVTKNKNELNKAFAFGVSF